MKCESNTSINEFRTNAVMYLILIRFNLEVCAEHDSQIRIYANGVFGCFSRPILHLWSYLSFKITPFKLYNLNNILVLIQK